MAVEYKRYRFDVDEYHRMGEAGIFHEDDRVELIDGEIVEMSPIGSGHNSTVARGNHTFSRRFGDVALVWVQSSFRLARHDEPLPDIVLLKPRDDFYASAIPTAADAFLVVEVADSSLSYDLHTKAPRYAGLGVPELWVADLRNQAVHVHREPSPAGYRVIQTLRRGDKIAPLAFPDRELDVADLLGP
jgi:Uma2 family endonuclease